MEEIKFTIKEANNEINRITNLLNLYIDRKNLLFNETQPKVADPNTDRVDGSMTREEKFFKYVYKCENEDIEWWIEKLNIYIIALNNYVESELKRIGEYEPLKAKIIKLREEKGMKWNDIAEATHYCRRQCINIYKNYTGKRNVEDCTPIALLK
nr:MAG TPA: Protein of unknown function (DUF722) [Caudoviricetes sp.]